MYAIYARSTIMGIISVFKPIGISIAKPLVQLIVKISPIGLLWLFSYIMKYIHELYHEIYS